MARITTGRIPRSVLIEKIEWTDRLKPVDSRNTLKGTKATLPTFFTDFEIVCSGCL